MSWPHEEIKCNDEGIVITGVHSGANKVSIDKSVHATTTTHVHIHIHSNSESVIQKTMRAIDGLFGKRHITVKDASQISEQDIQRQLNIGNGSGRHERIVSESNK